MRRAERLFRLVNEMRTRSVSRACDLAVQFEVSVRTIYRDIAHLQASGLPIEGEAGIGYLLRPGFSLPPVTFTNEQIDALAIALSCVESLDDPEIVASAKEVRSKIQATLPLTETRKLADAPFYSLGRSAGAPKYGAVMRKAIRLQRTVRMTYEDRNGRQTKRVVRPLAIWNFDEGWMVSAWCELRQTFRTFRFDRITDLVLTDHVFDNDDAKGLRAFLASDECRA